MSGNQFTASDITTSFVVVGQTNMQFLCLDDYSATSAQMQSVSDPFPSNTESLATTGAGELERLRYQIAAAQGTQYWYHRSARYGRAQGITAANNSGTPNTQFDLDADMVELGCPTCGAVTRINPGAALTNNISTAGPAANGRDQSGAFTDPSFVHFYWIWSGTTLATISSATAPPSGPVAFPTGYTHWSYCCSTYLTGGALRRVTVRGSCVYYDAFVNALANGSSTTDAGASVDISTIIPPNALAWKGRGKLVATTDGSGAVVANVDLMIRSSTIALTFDAAFSGWGATVSQILYNTTFELPNVGQAFLYDWDITTGTTPQFTVDVLCYSVPNGS